MHIFSIARKKAPYKPVKPVSVIICAKNEANQLKRNLPSVLQQRYTNETGNSLFEVIVVNDGSTDDTETVLLTLKNKYRNLYTIDVADSEPKTFPGKKNALNKALAKAKYDVLLMTDADCTPASDMWLQLMVQPIHEGKEIVAGYGKYRLSSGWLNSFIRWETVHSFLQLSTYARAGHPYMAVGRNMACTKDMLLKAQTAPQWPALPSGDDDLLVRTAATKTNMATVANPMAFTMTNAKGNLTTYIRQKQRHLSTGKYYKFVVKTLLAKYGLSHALMWVLTILLMFTPLWGEVLIILLLRSLVYWSVWQRTACILKEKKLVRFFPLFDFGWMVYNFVFSPYIIWKNKQQWT